MRTPKTTEERETRLVIEAAQQAKSATTVKDLQNPYWDDVWFNKKTQTYHFYRYFKK